MTWRQVLADIVFISARRQVRILTPDPRFHVDFAPGYHPTEPLTPDEWPDDLR